MMTSKKYRIYDKEFTSNSCRRLLTLFTITLLFTGMYVLDTSAIDGNKIYQDWSYHEEIAITLENVINQSSIDDQNVLIEMDTRLPIASGQMKADGSDIRITDEQGNLLDYWIESGLGTSNTRIWVKATNLQPSEVSTGGSLSVNDNWERIVIDPALDGAHDIVPEDIDGDGKVDLVADAYVAEKVVWYKQPEDPTGDNWEMFTIDPNLPNAHDIQIGDIDGDGVKDVVGVGLSDSYANYNLGVGYLRWYKKGENPREPWQIITIASSAEEGLLGVRSLGLGDIDQDGDLDIAVAVDAQSYSETGKLIWYENPGGADALNPELWNEYLIDDTIGNGADAQIEDIDGDGRMDIVYSGNHGTSEMTTVYFAPADPKEIDGWEKMLLTGQSYHVYLVDFDKDGDKDILRANGGAEGGVSWLENPNANAARNPDEWNEYLIEQNQYTRVANRVFPEDIDHDGDLDIMMVSDPSTAAGYVRWYRTPDDPRDVEAYQHYMIDGNDFYTAWSHDGYVADINDDGNQDIMAVGCKADTVLLYLNPYAQHSGQTEQTKLYLHYGNKNALSVSDYHVFDSAGEDLVGYWNMGEQRGAVAYDQSQNDNDAQVVDALWVRDSVECIETAEADGSGYTGLILDGTDDQLIVDNDPSIEMQQLTVEARFTLEENKNINWIVSKDYTSWAQPYYSYTMYTNALGELYWMLNDGQKYKLCKVKNAVEPGKEYHVAGTFNDEYMMIYIDGELTKACYTGDFDIAYQDTPLLMGNQLNYGENAFFKGTIKEIRLYDSALTQEQIAEHAKGLQAAARGRPVKQNKEFNSDWSDWRYRKEIMVYLMDEELNAEIVGKDLAKLTIQTKDLMDEGKLQDDADDLRFTDSLGNQLDYWIEGTPQKDYTNVWVRLPQRDPAAGAQSVQGQWNRIIIDEDIIPNNIATSDVDGDGKIDVIAQSHVADSIYWYEQSEEGIESGWTKHLVDDRLPNGQDIQTGDIDGDGEEDIVAVSLSSSAQFYSAGEGALVWYKKDNSNDQITWTKTVIAHSDSDGLLGARSTGLGDIDGDGDLDIAVAVDAQTYKQTGRLYWYQNPGGAEALNPGSWNEYLIDDTIGNGADVKVVDIDDDGNADLVYSGNHGTPEMTTVYFAPSDPTQIQDWERVFVANQSYHIDVVDFDYDGDLDILRAGAGDSIVSWIENPSGNLARIQTEWNEHQIEQSEYAYGVNQIIAEDIDLDGDLDISTVANPSYKSGYFRWYRVDENPKMTQMYQSYFIDADSQYTASAHDGTMIDIDGDGDKDMLGVALASGKVLLWVNPLIKQLQDTQDSVIVSMYYGNPNAQEGKDFDATFEKQSTNENIIGAWSLDENSEYIAQDSSGKDNNAILSGTPTWIPADSSHWADYTDTRFSEGGSLELDGIDDYLQVESDDSLKLNEFTIQAWITLDQHKNYNAILLKQSPSWAQPYYSYGLYTNRLGSIAVVMNDGSKAIQCNAREVLQVDKEYFLAATYDSNDIRIYLDGEELVSCEVGNVALMNYDTPITIGKFMYYESVNTHFDGKIDELKLYDRALTIEEIKDTYHRTDSSEVAKLAVIGEEEVLA